MQYHQIMRTTLEIDDDILSAAKDLAQREGSTAGRVLSRLAREALTGGNRQFGSNTLSVAEPRALYGFRPFPKNGSLVTNELINQLKDQEGL
jgi:hypothetical protein